MSLFLSKFGFYTDTPGYFWRSGANHAPRFFFALQEKYLDTLSIKAVVFRWMRTKQLDLFCRRVVKIWDLDIESVINFYSSYGKKIFEVRRKTWVLHLEIFIRFFKIIYTCRIQMHTKGKTCIGHAILFNWSLTQWQNHCCTDAPMALKNRNTYCLRLMLTPMVGIEYMGFYEPQSVQS